jgi:hypothetical protein
MSWDDAGLRERFSDDAYQGILALLTSGDPDSALSGLQTLADTLAYGDQNLLSSFPVPLFCQEMTRLLGSAVELVQESAALCVFHVLEAHPNSTRELINAGCLEVMKTILMSMAPVGVAENLLRAADIVSQYRADDLAQRVGIAPIIGYFDFLPVIDQRIIAKTISQMSSQAGGYPEFVTSISQVLRMVRSPDDQVVRHAVNSLCAITSNRDPSTFPPTVVPELCEAIATVGDPRLSLRLIQLLASISLHPAVGQGLVGFDFGRLLLAKDAEIRQHAVQIILNVLPGKDVPKQVLQVGKSHGIAGDAAVQFATSVQPLLMQCLVEHIGFEQNIVVALAITLQLHDIAVPIEVINVICGLTQRPPLATAILFFAQCVSDKRIVWQSGLLRLLRSVDSSGDKWFNTTLARLSRKGMGPDVEAFQMAKVKTLQQMLVTIRDQKVGAFQLVQEGFFERATALVKGTEKVSPVLFEPLVSSLFELLLCLPIEPVHDPFGGSVDDFKNCSIGVQLVHGKRHVTYSYLPIESFAGAEAIWNYNTNQITHDMLTAAYRDAGPVAEICPLPQQFGELSSRNRQHLHHKSASKNAIFAKDMSPNRQSTGTFTAQQRANLGHTSGDVLETHRHFKM